MKKSPPIVNILVANNPLSLLFTSGKFSQVLVRSRFYIKLLANASMLTRDIFDIEHLKKRLIINTITSPGRPLLLDWQCVHDANFDLHQKDDSGLSIEK